MLNSHLRHLHGRGSRAGKCRVEFSLSVVNTLSSIVFCTVLLNAFPENVRAFDLSWKPRARVSMRGTDNVLTSPIKPEGALGFDNGGGVTFKAEDVDWNSTLTPDFTFRRFAIGRNLDANEYGVASDNQYSFSPKLGAALGFDYRIDSSLNQVFRDARAENAVKDRRSISVSPRLNYALTNEFSVNTNFSYNTVSYLDAADSGLIDYDYMQAGIGAAYDFDKQTNLFGNLFISKFVAPSASNKSVTYGFQVGVSRRLTETISAEMAAGYSRSDINFVERQLGTIFVDQQFGPFIVRIPQTVVFNIPRETSVDGPIASVILKKAFENATGRFEYSRQVGPTPGGTQATDESYTLSLQWEAAERLTVVFSGALYERGVQTANINTASQSLTVAQLASSLTYYVNETLSFGAEYRLGRDSADSTAYVNAVMFTLNYDGLWHHAYGN